RLRVSPRLPLHIRRCIRPSARKWHHVVLSVTGAGTFCVPGRWARGHQLEGALDRAWGAPPTHTHAREGLIYLQIAARAARCPVPCTGKTWGGRAGGTKIRGEAFEKLPMFLSVLV